MRTALVIGGRRKPGQFVAVVTVAAATWGLVALTSVSLTLAASALRVAQGGVTAVALLFPAVECVLVPLPLASSATPVIGVDHRRATAAPVNASSRATPRVRLIEPAVNVSHRAPAISIPTPLLLLLLLRRWGATPASGSRGGAPLEFPPPADVIPAAGGTALPRSARPSIVGVSRRQRALPLVAPLLLRRCNPLSTAVGSRGPPGLPPASCLSSAPAAAP